MKWPTPIAPRRLRQFLALLPTAAAFALLLMPQPAAASMARCQDFSERGLHESAIRFCTSVLRDANAPARADALFFRANSRYSTGDVDGALADVNAALSGSSENPRALALRGAIRLAGGDARQAIADLDRAVALGFVDIRVLRQRADAWLALGEPGNAIADLEEIVARTPADAVALTQLALGRLAEGSTAAAEAAADRAVAANSAYAPAYGVRAAIAAARGDIEAALADYTSARGAAPDDPGYRVGRASLLFQAGSLRLALAEIDRALEIEPGLVPALELRADIRQELGDLPGALADLEAAGPPGAATATRMARLALQLGDAERAERAYGQAIAEGPPDARLYFERGQARALRDRHEEAQADFDAALAINPDLAASGIMMMRGRARFATGNMEGAASDFAFEAERTPDAASPLIWQVRTLADLGDYEAAEAAARRLLALEPDTARANAVLGDVLLRRGDLAGGRAAHQAALAIDPGYEPSMRRLDELAETAN